MMASVFPGHTPLQLANACYAIDADRTTKLSSFFLYIASDTVQQLFIQMRATPYHTSNVLLECASLRPHPHPHSPNPLHAPLPCVSVWPYYDQQTAAFMPVLHSSATHNTPGTRSCRRSPHTHQRCSRQSMSDVVRSTSVGIRAIHICAARPPSFLQLYSPSNASLL